MANGYALQKLLNKPEITARLLLECEIDYQPQNLEAKCVIGVAFLRQFGANTQENADSSAHPICHNANDLEKCEEFVERLGQANENIDKHEG